MFGVDAAIPAGDFVFRLEGAYFPARYIQTNAEYQVEKQISGEKADDSKRQHQLLALAGFDWTPSGGWTVTAQYVADGVFADNDDIKQLERRRYLHQATLSVEKTLLNEMLTISAECALDLSDLSSANELSAEYSLSDSIKLYVIGDFFFKGIDGKKGMYGEYCDLSCVTLKAKLSF